MTRSPDIAQATVQRTLIALQKDGSIVKLGGGRYTSYPIPAERLYQPYYGEGCQTCGMKLTCNGCSRCGKCS